MFWTAFWAFGLGYLVSAGIQVFVSRERMYRHLGRTGLRSVVLASLFGFLSSSCSFAALAATRSLFAKGAGLVPALAFLLASTNLVVELGIVIAVFLGGRFVVGEYAGALLLILFVGVLARWVIPSELVDRARERAREETEDDDEAPDWRRLIRSREGWRRVAEHYAMEWSMVWKDVVVGFGVAGAIATFVPSAFFESLFPGTGRDPGFLENLLQASIGPIAAFFTFIGSMGNVPLAAVLFSEGVGFAGVMAFLFSDLVVLPVLRIQARYYGWRMALWLLGVMLLALVASALVLHYGFAALGFLPDPSTVVSVVERTWFEVDVTLFLNLAFLAVSGVLVAWNLRSRGLSFGWGESLGERALTACACLASAWIGIGSCLPAVVDLSSRT